MNHRNTVLLSVFVTPIVIHTIRAVNDSITTYGIAVFSNHVFFEYFIALSLPFALVCLLLLYKHIFNIKLFEPFRVMWKFVLLGYLSIISGVYLLKGLYRLIDRYYSIDLESPLTSFNFSTLNLLLACIVAPVLEELVYRRTLIQMLDRHVKPYLSIALSAVLFGVSHHISIDIFQLVYMGFILGVVYKITNTSTSIVLHFAVNLIGISTILSKQSTLDGRHSTATFGAIELIACIMILTYTLFYLLREFQSTNEQDIDVA